MAKVRSKTSSVIVSKGVVGATPALLTTTDTSPKCSTTCANALATSSRLETSATPA